MKNHGNKKSTLDSVFNSSKLLQVHTGDQSVLPTPRHSFVALSLPRSAQCPCIVLNSGGNPWKQGERQTHTRQLPGWSLAGGWILRRCKVGDAECVGPMRFALGPFGPYGAATGRAGCHQQS